MVWKFENGIIFTIFKLKWLVESEKSCKSCVNSTESRIYWDSPKAAKIPSHGLDIVVAFSHRGEFTA